MPATSSSASASSSKVPRGWRPPRRALLLEVLVEEIETTCRRSRDSARLENLLSRNLGAPTGSAGDHFSERGGREHARGPCFDLLDGGRRNALFDVSVHRFAEALPQEAQQQLLDALLAALLAPLFKDLLSGGHDGVLGFGSEIAFEKSLQRLGSDVLVDFENIAHHLGQRLQPVWGSDHLAHDVAKARYIVGLTATPQRRDG